MNPSLKDLDRIIGGLNPELQCGVGVLADVCVWYVAFKKQLEELLKASKQNYDTASNMDEFAEKSDLLSHSWGRIQLIKQILGEDQLRIVPSEVSSQESSEEDTAKPLEEYKATEDVRDRALNYHKLALSDF